MVQQENTRFQPPERLSAAKKLQLKCVGIMETATALKRARLSEREILRHEFLTIAEVALLLRVTQRTSYAKPLPELLEDMKVLVKQKTKRSMQCKPVTIDAVTGGVYLLRVSTG